MNILKPELFWLDNRCYRLFGNSDLSNTRIISPYVEDNDLTEYKEYDEDFDDDIEIVPYGATKFKHTFHVAKSFFPFIIGSKNTARKRLETETRTVIQIPKIGQDGNIVIIGVDHKGIMTARHRINLLVEARRKRLRPTHFLSIPLNEGHIIMKFNMFKNEILTNSGKNSRSVNEMIFQTPSKLHFTIGVLTLLDDTERSQAIEALDYCKKHIIKPIIEKHGQICISLQGTDIMNDDPTEVKVLYAKILNTNNALQEIADKVSNHYVNIGLSPEKKETVKLHVTVINTKFGSDSEEAKCTEQKTFDATEILKVHENTFFGETTIKQIHISQRHTISSNGYYQATAKINLFDD